MDFTLSAEQLLLKDSVARFAANQSDPHADHWKSFSELGWLALAAPDEVGGFGGAVERLLLMEQFGRGLIRSAYVAQVVFAGTILRLAERLDLLEAVTEGRRRFAVAYEEPNAHYDPAHVETTVDRDSNGWIVRGSKVRVLDASSADTLIVSARSSDGIALVSVPSNAPNLKRTAYKAEDGYDVADITFDGVHVDEDALLVTGSRGLAVLEEALDHATSALCAEALGLCAFMLEATVGYTKEREQFGVPLSSFQALQHRMAEMYVELELTRSMAYHAAMTLEDETDPVARKRGISAAKAQIAKSGRFIGQQTVQLHGGIGMSEEYRVGHYFKRMTFIERLLGDRDFHLRRYVELRYTPAREPVTV